MTTTSPPVDDTETPTPDRRRNGFIVGLARFCVAHRWMVVGIWVALMVVANMAASAIGPDYRTDFTLPGGEASDVQELLEANNPDRAGFTSQIVIVSESGFDDPAVQSSLQELFDFVTAEGDIAVTSPYDNPAQISQDGTIAFAQLDIRDTRDFTELEEVGDEIVEFGDTLVLPEGVAVEYGGDLFSTFELPESEVYGLIAAVIILVFAFGSVLAMGLPIGTALFGLGVASALVSLASNLISMPDFTQTVLLFSQRESNGYPARVSAGL